MKLYFAPGACSLADHIALHQAGLSFQHEKVDLKAKRTESGEDYASINPKGYVPALRLDSGELLTENIAILDWIAHQSAAVALPGPMGHTHLLEALAFISTELHKSFKPFFAGADDAAKSHAKTLIRKRMDVLADTMKGPYLFGDTMSVADCYLFTMLTWAKKFDLDIPEKFAAFRDMMMEQQSVRTAMEHEGLR